MATAQFELNYEKSSRVVEGVSKDEEIRKLKIRIAIKEDEVEELNEQLAKEEERADLILQDLEGAAARADDRDGEIRQLLNELRVKSRELETAKVGTYRSFCITMADLSTGRGCCYERYFERYD